MAFYVMIVRLELTEASADYGFGSNETALGRLRIDRGTGDVTLLSPAPGDRDEHFFKRAAFKVRQHWARGELPEKTCWAS